ncbi:MAG: leucine-rich repeat protein [Bacillales bacterium]
MTDKKEKNKFKRRRNVIIAIITLLLLLLLGLFGCKTYNNNKINRLLDSIYKLDNYGYWTNNKGKQVTDKQNSSRNLSSYDYYKKVDTSYNKSLEEFIKDYQNKNLPKKFSVEFFKDDSNILEKREYNYLEKIVFPSDLKKDGYTFKGWKLIPYYSDVIFTSQSNVLVDDDFKFYSIFDKNTDPNINNEYKVEFIVDNKIFKEFNVKNGEKIKEFNAPEKTNHLFLGWYDELDNKYNFNNPINKNLRLKAKYISSGSVTPTNKYKVDFFVDASLYKTFNVVEGSKIAEFEGPVKENCLFLGWYDQFGNKYDFDNPITKNLILRAKYFALHHTVEFIGDGVSNLPSKIENISHGSKIAKPDISLMSKVGHTFANKFLDQHGNEFIFNSTPVNENLLLTPVFNINKYKITFIKEADVTSVPSDIENVEYNSIPAAPDTSLMSKPHHTFTNKYRDQDGQEFVFGVNKVVKDLNLTPIFEVTKYKIEFINNEGEKIREPITDIAPGTSVPAIDTSFVNKEGYTFTGKFFDQDYNEFKFGVTPVNKDLILKPELKIKKYKIKFNANPEFDNIPSEITDIEHGSKVNKPAGYDNFKCNVEGYTLKGLFYTDSDGIRKEFKFNETIVKSNIELTIEKTIKRHKVTIQDHEGKIISENEYNYNHELTLNRYTNEYVYDYYENIDNSSEHFNDVINEDSFKYIVNKDIKLKAKGHKKFVKFQVSSDIKVTKQNGDEIIGNKIEVATGKPLQLPKVIKDGFYRITPIVWQQQVGGSKVDYNETIFNSKLDLTLTLKDEPHVFDDLFLYEIVGDHVVIKGIKDKYKVSPNLVLDVPATINDVEVTTIGNLSNLDNVVEIKLPNNFKYIEKHVFTNCKNLQRIDLSKTQITDIPEGCFSECKELEELLLPKTLKNIGLNAFLNCKKLKNIDLENTSIEHINTNTFFQCYALENIKLPSTLKTLGTSAFASCTSVKEIDLSKTKLERIPLEAFKDCKKTKKISLPTTLKYIDKDAFSNCKELNKVNLENTKVVEIKEGAFAACNKLQKIKLPSTCEKLGVRSFAACYQVEQIDLKDSKIKTIPTECFQYCSEAVEINLPTTLEKVEDSAFLNCAALTDINLEETSLKEIGNKAFYVCKKLGKIKLPSTVTTIGDEAFTNCLEATEIDLSQTQITKLPKKCFFKCEKLTTLKLPATLTEIKESCFEAAENLDKIEFNGTKNQFKNIIKGVKWLTGHTHNFDIVCSDGTLKINEIIIP